MNFLEKADNVRSTKGSDRVLRCEDTGESYPIGQIADALAEKFTIQKRAAVLKLNHAVRNGKSAFGLRWSLESGTPFAPPRPRVVREKKEGAEKKSKKNKAA